MNLELVSLLATDKIKLPGLLYSPDKPSRRAAIWLHGMGDNGVFYSTTRTNALGKALTEKGIALLAFNNRGAHNSKKLRIADEALPEEDRYFQGGTHYEQIVDCVYDIEGAVKFLEGRGYSQLYLIGHSTGANKICVYHIRTVKNPFQKYVLAGPGDDVGLFFQELGEKRFWQALKYAAQFTESQPLHLMPRYTGMYPFSAQAAWDILNPAGPYNTFPFYEATNERLGQKPLFEEYQQIDRPTLVIFGAEDEYTTAAGGADEALKLIMQQTSNARMKQTDFMLVPEADHSFHGQEEAFAKRVADWLVYG
ncbi:MAG TPA: alpha/beta hydrolase [Candidatus Saccharimonadales bacterium]|jgi:alpha-beta hydrolase superfamily lysophospholipase|nr:alpha/beta hydrolase [Candidatus Saccharimonadales bacterium]